MKLIDGITLVYFLKMPLWAWLLWMSRRHRLFGKYPLIFAYIFWQMSNQMLMPFVAYGLGRGSWDYLYAFLAAWLISALLWVAALLKIYFVFGPFSLRRDWILLAAPAAITVVGNLDAEGLSWFMRIMNIGQSILVFLGVAAVWRMWRAREVQLGWNLKMALLSLTVPTGFAAALQISYSINLTSFETVDFWHKYIAFSFWIIVAVGMSEYSPPARFGDSDDQRGLGSGELAGCEPSDVSAAKSAETKAWLIS